MKKRMLASALMLATTLVTTANAANPASGCAAKKQEIEQELGYAKQHGNTARVEGLENALRENSKYCTDSNLLKQRQLKINEKKEKLLEREKALEEARMEGRSEKKIAKLLNKVEDAREELREAEHELNQ